MQNELLVIKTKQLIKQIKSKNMNNQYHYIIDKSGSMSNCQKETIDGINEQFNSLRKLALEESDQTFKASLHLFNSQLFNICSDQRPEHLQNIAMNEYCPSGSTSLYDAIGIVASAERVKSATDVKEGTKKVVFVILTDGYENSSNLFNFDTIRKLISDMQDEGYIFLFLGAIIDAKDVAEKMNIKKENAHSFLKEEMKETFSKMSLSLENLAKEKEDWSKF